MLRGCENQRGSSALQKMIKKQGRLPRSPQEPGPRTKCRAEASLGHRARSPQPEGRRFSPSTEEDPAASPSAAAATRPAGPASAASPPPTTTHHHPPPPGWPRGRAPPTLRRGSTGPRPPPRSLSGSPWPGAKSAGPKTASKNRVRRQRSRTRRDRQPPPPPPPQLGLHRRLRPRPVRAQPARAPSSRHGCQGERTARSREGARSAPRMRAAAERERARGVGCPEGVAGHKECAPPGSASPC